MIQTAVVHLLIALVWLFLSGNTTPGGLGTGLLAGFALLALFRRALDCQDYVRRVMAVLAFAWHFLKQVVASNLRIARLALRRDAGTIQGRFLKYSVEGLSEFELLLFCWCLSLTPGTAVVDRIGADALILHAFGSGEPDEVRRHIDRDIRDSILTFTR